MDGVPWCDHCSRFLSPSTVLVDGACPACGRPVDPGRAHAPTADAKTEAPPADAAPHAADDDAPLPIPWHLKLLAGALAVYLGYRFVQMGEWLWHAVT
jgi:hypothetical protein